MSFTNITEGILWELTSDAVKKLDSTTTQFLSQGETERFMHVVGDTIVSLFNEIDSSYNVEDPYETKDSMLNFLMRSNDARWFTSGDAETNTKIRTVLVELISAWRLKGTKAFLHWVIYKVFGWTVTDIHSYSTLLYTNISSSTLYNPELTPAEQALMYGEELFDSLNPYTLVIEAPLADWDVDILDPDKKEVLERLLTYWTVPTKVTYIKGN